MKFFPRSRIKPRPPRERGYILIALILFVALLAIAMTAMAPVISQQVKRDREEELIHRGVQYARAIKHYVKKFGRYPTKIEDLENTNNVRFLRKRYKDPITGKDFKILHMGEVQTSFGPGITGATSAASLAAGSQAAGGAFGNNAFGNSSSFGNNSFGGSAFGGSSFGGNTFGPGIGGGTGGSSLGGNTFGSSNSAQGTSAATNPAQGAGVDTGEANAGANPDQSQGAQGTPGAQGQPGQGNQVFGGGPIVGVASTSKEKSIRVFNKKEHYYQWQFIYDPTTDRGGLLSTPNQPGLQSLGGGMQQGIPGQPGTQNSPFGGQSSAFGNQGSPFGNEGSPFGAPSGNPMSPGGMQPVQPGPTQQQMPQPQFPPDQGPQQ